MRFSLKATTPAKVSACLSQMLNRGLTMNEQIELRKMKQGGEGFVQFPTFYLLWEDLGDDLCVEIRPIPTGIDRRTRLLAAFASGKQCLVIGAGGVCKVGFITSIMTLGRSDDYGPINFAVTILDESGYPDTMTVFDVEAC